MRPPRQSQRLTEAQERVFDFVCEEIASGDGPPSQAAIAREFGISPQGAAAHVKALVRKGWIVKDGRTIRLTDPAWRRQLVREQEQGARATLPRGVLTGGHAKAVVMVRSVMRRLDSVSQQMVLEFASR